MDQRTFWGIARAHLLNVGIIRPGPHVTAIEINVYLSSPTGAPVTVGKITDPDKADVPRFLNRCVIIACLTSMVLGSLRAGQLLVHCRT